MNGLPHFKTPTLALDPALATGWAFGSGDQFEHGVWYLKGASAEHTGAPLIRMERLIREAHERFGVQRIVFENASQGSVHENVKVFHNRVSGVILATAAKIGATWDQYVPTTIKAFSGHGRYKKPQMIAALERHYGITVRSDDECDAIWILLLDQQRRSSPLAQVAAKTKRKSANGRKPKDPTLF